MADDPSFEDAVLQAECEQVRETALAMGLPPSMAGPIAETHRDERFRKVLRQVHAAGGATRQYVAYRVLIHAGDELLRGVGRGELVGRFILGAAAATLGYDIVSQVFGPEGHDG